MSRSDRGNLVAAAVAGAAALLVVVAYVLRAWVLITYPWDWSPDEGMHLDYARRALEAPGTLYPRRAVPFPSAYGPLLPVLMAPLVRLGEPLMAARLMALAWALVGAGAVGEILRRRAGPLWAAAGVALYLAPFDLSFWHMLVRVDGPMIALWLWAAVPLLPRDIERGADSLSRGRLAAGTALLLASVLVKPTAALHGAPLVLGWFLVDRRSAWRLSAATAGGGLTVLGILQAVTGGGFLWVNRLWGLHPRVSGLAGSLMAYFGVLAWPVILLAAAGALVVSAARSRPHREPALLLVAGGLAVAPIMGKQGASWNYMLPLFAALVVAAGCWFARAARTWSRPRPSPSVVRLAPALATTALAITLASTRPFPLPSTLDEATARAFYRFTQEVHRSAGGPFLVSRPDLVYFLAGQAEEVEGSSFSHLAAGGARGAGDVLERLRDGRYTLVVVTWPLPETPEWRDALREGYRHVGGCGLGWYFGVMTSHVLVRRDLSYAFVPPAGTRCAVAAATSSP